MSSYTATHVNVCDTGNGKYLEIRFGQKSGCFNITPSTDDPRLQLVRNQENELVGFEWHGEFSSNVQVLGNRYIDEHSTIEEPLRPADHDMVHRHAQSDIRSGEPFALSNHLERVLNEAIESHRAELDAIYVRIFKDRQRAAKSPNRLEKYCKRLKKENAEIHKKLDLLLEKIDQRNDEITSISLDDIMESLNKDNQIQIPLPSGKKTPCATAQSFKQRSGPLGEPPCATAESFKQMGAKAAANGPLGKPPLSSAHIEARRRTTASDPWPLRHLFVPADVQRLYVLLRGELPPQFYATVYPDEVLKAEDRPNEIWADAYIEENDLIRQGALYIWKKPLQ